MFEAKYKWHKDRVFKQFKPTTKKMFEDNMIADEYDTWMRKRVEFMYSYLDFDYDRARIRDRFLEQMNKKTTLRDIGEKLDEFVLTPKALNEYWHDSKHILEQPKSPTMDKDETDFDWCASIVASLDPKKPNWLDDES